MEGLNELAGALAKAQGEMRAAEKNRINPFFKSKYATLDSCWEAARAPLSSNGLSILQRTEVRDGGLILITTLLHSSGQSVSSSYPLSPIKDDPQGMGSCLTYARRYCFAAIVGIVADEDDDGEAAIQRDHSTDLASVTQKLKSKSKPEPKPISEFQDLSNHLAKPWLDRIAECKTLEDLEAWGAANAVALEGLLPLAKALVREAFKQRKSTVGKADS